MGRLAQLWRTTTVRLTALFLLIFCLFAVLLLGFISYQSSIQIQNQQRADIDREVAQLEQLDRTGNLRALARTVDRLARQPGPGIYFLGDAAGVRLVGNVAELPTAILLEPGTYSFPYDQVPTFEDEAPPPRGFAIVRSVVLESGLRLVVGRDVVERRGFSGIILQAFGLGVAGIVLLSLLAGAVMARRVLNRIDAINATSSKIMSGNLSERVPVTRRNDEFDGIAINLNAMLERIEHLLQGLKEVTDNVAHDLKTPLTRLRNQAESALRETATAEERQQALETVITESDKLIRTFNALLMIARAEAGAPSGAFADVDISAVAADVAELYGPSAEDAGIALEINVEPGVILRANRELIGQSLVNLIDNAIKYFDPDLGRPGKIEIEVRRIAGRVLIAVSDNGPGVPAEDRQRVIQRFVRLDESRAGAGSGLGLSLVAAVARLHRGEFRIEDNEPGVRAVMDLPAT